MNKILKKPARQNLGKLKSSAFGFIMLGISIGVGYEELFGIGTWHSIRTNTDKVNVCFTPPSGCGSLIAQQIADAKDSIYMQAYSLTSTPIIHQLVEAHKRGVRVQILLDRSNLDDRNSGMGELSRAGISIGIDKVSGIAHNKVIILDKQKIVTGSFNFSKAADYRNAENVVLINDKELAKHYLKNWENRKDSNLKTINW
jgi:phospholipase D